MSSQGRHAVPPIKAVSLYSKTSTKKQQKAKEAPRVYSTPKVYNDDDMAIKFLLNNIHAGTEEYLCFVVILR